MRKTLRDVFKLAMPITAEKKQWLEMAAAYLDAEDVEQLKYYTKIDKCFATISSFGTSKDIFHDKDWPIFKSHIQGKELHDFLDRINKEIGEKAKLDAFLTFSENGLEKITSLIAKNIVGMDNEKAVAAIQLFAKDPFHVLFIGDPGTGKTDILRSIHDLSPIGSFGLGSGVSGVGLSAAARGDEILKGLLPLAHEGIACIDELNLIKAKDLAALYNAMEKGFVTYDKGTKHESLPAKVRVAATANPANQVFIGKTAEVLRKQIPFGDALLSRFHFIFIVRKPSEKEFELIAKKIVKGEKHVIAAADSAFIKEYIHHADSIDVDVPPQIELKIVDFVKEIKQDEKKFLTEVGPRTVIGIVRIVRAIARSRLCEEANEEHARYAFQLIEKALYVRKGADDA